jgi:hypothetical protein
VQNVRKPSSGWVLVGERNVPRRAVEEPKVQAILKPGDQFRGLCRGHPEPPGDLRKAAQIGEGHENAHFLDPVHGIIHLFLFPFQK